ncbi:MAG: hypothetical protein WA945_07235 [Arcobacteraceae bacterium]
MRKSIVLLEVIFSLLLFSIIAIVSSKMIFSVVKKNTTDTFVTQNNLVLETTRLFLSKQDDLTKVTFNDNALFFDNHLLLNNVSKYNTTEGGDVRTIDICIYEDTICQIWKMKI